MTLVRAHVDLPKKRIELTFLRSDENEEVLYQVNKKIKYIIRHLPGREDVVHCPCADTVSTVLLEYGIRMSKWQIYRYLRNGGFGDILKEVKVEPF